MLQIKNNLKICSLLNLLTALFLFFLLSNILFIPIIFLASTSYYYYSCSKMSDEKLLQNKNNLLILGIISILFNILTAIILLTSLNRMPDSVDKQVEKVFDAKIDGDKPNYLLYTGPILIILSSFLLFNFNMSSSSLFKVIFLFVIGILFLFLSKYAKNNVYLLISFMFFVFTYYYLGKYTLLGKYFSIYGDGKYLFKSTFYIISFIFAYIYYKKSQKTIYLRISYLFVLLSSFSLFRFIKFDISDIILIHNMLLLIFNLIREAKNIKNDTVTSITNIICAFIVFTSIIYTEQFNYLVLLLINLLISITNIIYILFNDKKNKNIFIALIYLLVFKSVFFVDNINIELVILLISLFLMNIFNLFLRDNFDTKLIMKINNTIFNVLAIYILLTFTNYNPYLFFIMTILIFLYSLFSIKIKVVDNKLVYNLAIVDFIFIIISILNVIDNYININYNIILIIIFFIFIFIFYLSENNFIKKNSFLISIISLLIDNILFEGSLFVTIIAILILALYKLKEHNNYDNLFIFGIISLIISLLFKYINILSTLPLSVYILIIGIFITIYVVYKDSKK